MDCCCRSCSTAWTPPVAPFSTHNGAVQARRPSAETRGATSRPSLQPCASSGCRAGSAGAHSFPQTGAEQGYPHPAYDASYSKATMLAGAIDGVSDDEGQAAATLAAIQAFAASTPTIYLPAHDPDAARRLAEGRTTPSVVLSPASRQHVGSTFRRPERRRAAP